MAFVVFEGLDGAGKSTHIRRLAESLETAGMEVLAVREPGGTEAGEAIRDIMFGADAKPLEPLTWALLMNAARAQLVTKRIRPALDSGVTVLADRYWYSTMAYQGGGDGVAPDLIRGLARVATGGLEPDIVVYLELDPEEVASRKHRDPNVLDSRPLEFHQAVAQAYSQMVADDPERWLVFDASPPKDILSTQIRERVMEKLGLQAKAAAT